MRLTLATIAIALLLTPMALTAQPAVGLHAQATTDVSAVKRKTTPKKAKKKEEYLKAAPGTGPSGPAK